MQSLLTLHPNLTATEGPIHHVISGSFRSISLFLLAFSPIERTLSLIQKVDALGPHQYLATNPRRDRVYATTWAQPPTLSSWAIEREETSPWRLSFINNVSITATSSYINIPPPFTHAYSAGGPTGEVHAIEPVTGALKDKVQEILFIPEDELANADKTAVALRYGSHAVEFSSDGLAFIPVLGTDKIEMYRRDTTSGRLTHIMSVPSPRGPNAHDAPRHLKIHPNGKVLYCVTEHTNFVDAYTITPTTLTYLDSRSLLPAKIDPTAPPFRGDTLVLAPSTSAQPTPRTLFATTRGGNASSRGWLSAFALEENGTFAPMSADGQEYWETPTSGGKANALDVLPKGDGEGEGVWILLTDDDSKTAGEAGGGIRVLEWEGMGKGVNVVAGWPPAGENVGEFKMEGGSHAIWLD
ncbi:hypothetical protein H0H81_002413 [Sphagnurus paluster]|uniref:Muconate cycloisomerase 1 n=1 Tax=Sphagnurus paluster TaxID=117069 RepID=A0A9P7FVQ3_9AGAR|nr:hypothetical protein H0H81_002413 [Sphagnurus paluster]